MSATSTPASAGALARLYDATAGEALRRQPQLAAVGLALVAMMLPSAVAALVDARTLYGVEVWVKPLKFQASTGLYLLTLAWFWNALPSGFAATRLGRAIAWTAVSTAVFEVAWITWRAAQAEPSHFATTPFGMVMFALMGIAALALTATSPVLAYAILRHGRPAGNRTYRRAVIVGLVLTFVLGAGVGLALSANGSHWVGAAGADGAGLPVFGWSRTVGDLRVAHFFGLHLMQVLPLAAWIVGGRRGGGLIVTLFGLAWTGLTVWTFAEALSGRPFLPMIG